MFSVLSALHTFSIVGANLQAKLDELNMGDSAMLKVLNLSGNAHLEGPLPATWADSLTSLVALDLSGIQAMVSVSHLCQGTEWRWQCTLNQLQPSESVASAALSQHCH
jgi:hypothetical protein